MKRVESQLQETTIGLQIEATSSTKPKNKHGKQKPTRQFCRMGATRRHSTTLIPDGSSLSKPSRPPLHVKVFQIYDRTTLQYPKGLNVSLSTAYPWNNPHLPRSGESKPRRFLNEPLNNLLDGTRLFLLPSRFPTDTTFLVDRVQTFRALRRAVRSKLNGR